MNKSVNNENNNTNSKVKEFDNLFFTVHTVAQTLLQWLNELPEPLLGYEHYDAICACQVYKTYFFNDYMFVLFVFVVDLKELMSFRSIV